jgi:succinate-semialdehyde dehydrogenase/glutarate-semialdehyde dehydrogenase
VDDAVSKGAQIVCGGRQANLGGTFYMPTMLTNVDSSMVMTKEETFGPVIGITK